MAYPNYENGVMNVEYLDDNNDQTAEEIMEQLNLPMDKLIEAIESKIENFEHQLRAENDDNFVIHVGPQVGFPHWMLYRKFHKMCRKIYDPENRTTFGKSFEELILYFFLAVVTFGVGIFIFAIGYRYYSCTEFSDTLLKRIGKIQNEKVNLLKIIDEYTYQNISFLEEGENKTE